MGLFTWSPDNPAPSFGTAKDKELGMLWEQANLRRRGQVQASGRAAKLPRGFDKWNTREKAGPAGAEYFYGKGSEKQTIAVPFSDKYPYHSFERQRAVKAAKAGVIPRESPAAEKTRAEAEEISYATEFKKGARDTLESILETERGQAITNAAEAALELTEAKRKIDLRNAELEPEEARIRAETEAEETRIAEKLKRTARPKREMNPALKKRLWEGYPGMFGSPEQFHGAYKLFEKGTKRIRDWAYPEVK